MLSRVLGKIKRFLLRKDVYLVLIVILVGAISFGLGILSEKTSEPQSVTITEAFSDVVIARSANTSSGVMETSELVVPAQDGIFVGSKNSDKYHYPWCPGAQRIKESNKVWFNSVEEAESRGYEPAKNCEGLE